MKVYNVKEEDLPKVKEMYSECFTKDYVDEMFEELGYVKELYVSPNWIEKATLHYREDRLLGQTIRIDLENFNFQKSYDSLNGYSHKEITPKELELIYLKLVEMEILEKWN